MSFRQVARLVLMSAILLLPRAAWAQSAASGSIAGVAKDTSGAVLPGVTVEAASPALIEKVRSVVTDGQGQYKIVDLRPGLYTVTFTLPGFNTFRREGIELATGVTVTANADLPVGTLEETVTVTGASPLVDVQNVRSQTVLSRDVLDTLPTNKSIQGFAAIIVGMSAAGTGGVMQDVGGNRGEQFGGILIHGSRAEDGKILFDGMQTSSGYAGGGARSRFWIASQAAVQEVAVETTGMSAEANTGGIYQNFVPRDGGNVFKAYFNTGYANTDLQASNLTDEHRARGLTTTDRLKQVYDYGGGVGGPIARDRLWFHASQQWWGTRLYTATIEQRYYNKTQGTRFYTPDFDREEISNDYTNRDTSGRLTWQATGKHKINFYQSVQHNCLCSLGGSFQAPEARALYEFYPTRLTLGTWNYPATNRVLFSAGAGYNHSFFAGRLQPGVTTRDIPITELSTGLVYNAVTSTNGINTNSVVVNDANNMSQHNERFVVSYITGSHAFKAGVTTLFTGQKYRVGPNEQGLSYFLNRGTPVRIQQWAVPHAAEQSNVNLGLFAQDQWTVRKLTLNLGLRFDQVKGSYPDQERPGGRFVPAFQIAGVDNVVNMTDVSPRLGAAYDVFGNGKTAIKGSLGRYVAQVGVDLTGSVNPANTLAANALRTWTDRNGDFTPDCDLKNFAANGECGALNNRQFGTITPNTRYATDVLEGFAKRGYNWQTSLSVQHELRPGVAVNVGYFRTWYGNFLATDNLLVTPADFDSYCLTAPLDARLPGGGGYQICDLADVKPAKFGLVDSLVTQSSHFGTQKEIYNGIDATFNARFGKGGLVQGGTNVGRTAYQCVQVDAPVQFCNNTPPFLQEFKFSGVYPLPFWGLQASGTFQNLPGVPIGTVSVGGSGTPSPSPATWQAGNALIRPALGRDLAQGTNGVASIALLPPNTEFEEGRLTQVDLRFTKIVRLGRTRLQGNLDIYNLLNASNILGQNIQFGPKYRNALQILGGRLFKLGGQLDF